jgi:hypothetical protein
MWPKKKKEKKSRQIARANSVTQKKSKDLIAYVQQDGIM